MVKVAALWKKTGQKGEFLVGKMGDASIMVFKNTNKNAPNQPDYNVFIAEDKRPQGAKPNNNYKPKQEQSHAPSWDDGASEF